MNFQKRKMFITFVLILISCIFFGCTNTNNNTNMINNNSNNSNYQEETKKEINFIDLYATCDCEEPWAEYGIDYILLDTNPYNYDNTKYPNLSVMYFSNVENSIKKINEKLGIPQAVYKEMLRTNSYDGKQIRIYKSIGVQISWSYHPNNGLDVIYSKYVE